MPIRYLDDLPSGAEVVVVGGGVVGAATAFHASRAGLEVLVLERRPALATLTTAAAGGGFRLQQDNEEELFLVRESVELFLHFAEATGQREFDAGVRQQGYLWATRSETGAEGQRRLVELQRSWGVEDVEVLPGDEARARFPYLSGDVVQARFRQGDGLIEPRGVALGLAAAASAAGAAFAPGTGVTALRLHAGRVEVETTGGTLATDAAVICAGPFSGTVAGLAGVDLPLFAVRRHKLGMPEVPEVPQDAPMTIDDDTGAHWRPAWRGAALFYTDPGEPPSAPAEDVPVDHGFAFALLDPASPTAVAHVSRFWADVWTRGGGQWFLQAGQYEMTPDRRPLIGETGAEGIFVNTGYCGHGVMASPAGSRHLVDLVTGKASPQENPFRPDRAFERRASLDPL